MTGLPPSLDRVIGLSAGALDALLPMHLWIDPAGRIVQAGPTLTKMARMGALAGRPIGDVVALRRPALPPGGAALAALAGQRIGLVLTRAPDLPLRGVLAALPGGAGSILDISLGLSFARGVAEFGLTMNDFSPCDQTVELLFLHEANNATTALSRQLSARLEAARAAAERQALTDPLTGLANRRAMDAALAAALADPQIDVGLMQIDLDLFKQVNDTLGHAAGDAVLARVGALLRRDLRQTDLAARVGGDEFLVLVADCDGPAELAALARRLIAGIEQPVPFAGQLCRVSASVGAATSCAYAERPTAERLLADVDAALYAAKRAGRGRHALHTGAAPPPRRRRTDPPAH
jgi:diguanylate cyclase (GGDEF)-like protein